ncbi:MAG: GNAT family N-acetyltransferase [Candidatus Levybacteria bacterium]|nr:GNAT family N-acetyltransferase [Candidatus Levybacteria bacterium]
MEGKVVYQGKSKKGNAFIIRYPVMGDVRKTWEYINKISKEKTFIMYQGEEISLEHETDYLTKQLQKIAKNQSVVLLVFIGEKLIGISGIDMRDRATSHQGVFGISIDRDFRGEGIGKKLIEIIIKEAKEKIPQLKIISLGVFGDNPKACKIYESFGFVELGRLPEGILHNGKYVDHIYMYKAVRN